MKKVIAYVVILSFFLNISAVSLCAFDANLCLINTGKDKINPIKLEGHIPQYKLPILESGIANYKAVTSQIPINKSQLSLLSKNGFVVIDTPKDIADRTFFMDEARREASPKDDFVAFYSALKNRDLPIFITADSILHYYHIFFDATLSKMERDVFYKGLWDMSQVLLDEAIKTYKNESGELKEAARRNAAYFSVALSLLKPKADQIFSDDILRKEYCTPEMEPEVCQMMIDGVKGQYGDKASIKYFSAADLKKYDFKIPSFVAADVKKELSLIDKHEGWEFSPIFIYKEDYSQYVPRGHYTQSERLKNYFKTTMWFGRMTALVNGSDSIPEGKSLRRIQDEGNYQSIDKGFISSYDAKIQTLQALLITKGYLDSKVVQNNWKKMYAITSFFVGASDDLGPDSYSSVLTQAVGKSIKDKTIMDKYHQIKKGLEGLDLNPKIYGGLDAVQMVMPCPPLTDEDLEAIKAQAQKLLYATRGFRLMGQRFTVDSYIFSELVSPYTGEYNGKNKIKPFTYVQTEVPPCPQGREIRGFPTGLDIMALLGSDRAMDIMRQLGDASYSDYDKKFAELKKEIDGMDCGEWFQNLYWNWLYVLQSLLVKYPSGYPTFMQSEAWQDKSLNTALASWAELRHDTLLYVKQSYTMAEMGGAEPPPIIGYVEPVPEFYTRLMVLTDLSLQGMKKLLTEEEMTQLNLANSLSYFSEVLSRLRDISKKELANQELEPADIDFIREFGGTSDYLVNNMAGGNVDPNIFKTTMIADVHTDGNTKKVLEEGVGYVRIMLAAYRHPKGHIILGVGPVFSYYEFKQPMSDRLTDEAWRNKLKSNPPALPEWIKTFSQ
ncbi:MAG: DUF3160 domain-containing protein [bacterium]